MHLKQMPDAQRTTCTRLVQERKGAGRPNERGWESDPRRVSTLAGRGIAGVLTNHIAALVFPRASPSAPGGLSHPISYLRSSRCLDGVVNVWCCFQIYG